MKFGMQVTGLNSSIVEVFNYVQPAVADFIAEKGKDCNGRVTVAMDSININ